MSYRVQLLEACVKNCGQKFHQELGKFKFLNELIRMISPKVGALYMVSLSSHFILCMVKAVHANSFAIVHLGNHCK